jgi:Uma2 family endonuclease
MVVQPLAPWAEPAPEQDRPMTADDLLALPEDEWQYELIAGRLFRMPPTGMEHNDLTGDLYAAVRSVATAEGLGLVTLPDTGFRVTRPGEEDTVLSPDVAFISAARLVGLPAPGTDERKKYFPLAPDLAVEIASPDQYRPEMAQKARLYLSVGVRLVWVVWPGRRQVDVWRPGADVPVETLDLMGSLDSLDVLPGFTYPLARLFG